MLDASRPSHAVRPVDAFDPRASRTFACAVTLMAPGAFSLALGAAGSAGTRAVAWTLVLGGVAHALSAFVAERPRRRVGGAVVSLVQLSGGIGLALHPDAGVVRIALGLGALFMAEGVTWIAVYFQGPRAPGAGWTVSDGAKALLLGVWIVGCWPGDAVRAMALTVGIDLLVSGFAQLAVALPGRLTGRSGPRGLRTRTCSPSGPSYPCSPRSPGASRTGTR